MNVRAKSLRHFCSVKPNICSSKFGITIFLVSRHNNVNIKVVSCLGLDPGSHHSLELYRKMSWLMLLILTDPKDLGLGKIYFYLKKPTNWVGRWASVLDVFVEPFFSWPKVWISFGIALAQIARLKTTPGNRASPFSFGNLWVINSLVQGFGL